MVRILALAALVAACSSPAHPTDKASSSLAAPSPSRFMDAMPASADASLVDAAVDAGFVRDASVGPSKKLGAHGGVCKLGFRHEKARGEPAPVDCGPGLLCCYPCGIDGCDFTCMTEDECDIRRP